MKTRKVTYTKLEAMDEDGHRAVRLELLEEGYDLIPFEEGSEKLELTDQFLDSGTTWKDATQRETPGNIPKKTNYICRRGLGAGGTPDVYAGHRIMNNILGVE